MADYEAKIAPFINQEFWVTSEFGEPREGRDPHKRTRYCNAFRFRSGQIYIQCAIGTIVYKTFDADGFGYYIIMKDNETGMGFLYGHLSEESPLNVGDSVQIGQYVGHEGTSRKLNRYTPSLRNARYFKS